MHLYLDIYDMYEPLFLSHLCTNNTYVYVVTILMYAIIMKYLCMNHCLEEPSYLSLLQIPFDPAFGSTILYYYWMSLIQPRHYTRIWTLSDLHLYTRTRAKKSFCVFDTSVLVDTVTTQIPLRLYIPWMAHM